MKFLTVCGIAALLAGFADAWSCTTDSDCGTTMDGNKCVSGTCGCNANADCTVTSYTICDTTRNMCGACATSADCTESYSPTCKIETGISNNYCSNSCTADADCQAGTDKNYKCTDSLCVHGMTGCSWEQKDTDNFSAKLMTGNIVGGIIGTIAVIIVSLPLCCGVTKGQKAGSCEMPKLIAGIGIGVGLFTMFIPLMGVSSATEGAIKDLCDGADCDCSDKNKEDFRAILGTIGAVTAYYVGGFMSIILGILAACLACCVCCKCCGPLAKPDEATSPGAAGAVVVGQPAGGARTTE